MESSPKYRWIGINLLRSLDEKQFEGPPRLSVFHKHLGGTNRSRRQNQSPDRPNRDLERHMKQAHSLRCFRPDTQRESIRRSLTNSRLPDLAERRALGA